MKKIWLFAKKVLTLHPQKVKIALTFVINSLKLNALAS
jgi:hypothetical protein